MISGNYFDMSKVFDIVNIDKLIHNHLHTHTPNHGPTHSSYNTRFNNITLDIHAHPKILCLTTHKLNLICCYYHVFSLG